MKKITISFIVLILSIVLAGLTINFFVLAETEAGTCTCDPNCYGTGCQDGYQPSCTDYNTLVWDDVAGWVGSCTPNCVCVSNGNCNADWCYSSCFDGILTPRYCDNNICQTYNSYPTQYCCNQINYKVWKASSYDCAPESGGFFCNDTDD